MSRIFYNQPSEEWEQALPVGCGRLGGMVYGGVAKELIQVNEENMWLGGCTNRINPDAKENLQKVREYLSHGETEKAERLLDVSFSGCPDGMRPYQTLGEIQLLFDGFGEASKRKSAKVNKFTLPQGVTGYDRSLDLDKALCTVSFEYGGTKYQREYFASRPHDCMVMRFAAQGAGTVDFTARLRRGRCFDGVKKTADGILLYGNLGRGGSDFAMELRCVSDGTVRLIGECTCVQGAKQAVLYFTAVTDKFCSSEEKENYLKNYLAQSRELPGYMQDLCGYEKQEYIVHSGILSLLQQKIDDILSCAAKLSYNEILSAHLKDYTALYSKCRLKLEGDDSSDLPTDMRLEKLKNGGTDNGLYQTMFDYGRYLTIACSRKGGLPANLQGIWNKEFFPPWDSKYTININTEMNYWHVEMCNLADCHTPLFDLLEKIKVSGRRTARDMYGCRGFAAHHNTDSYGDTAPQDTWYAGTYWVMGGAWLSTHLWEHYRYSQDFGFLQKAFPTMLEAALFLTDFATERDGKVIFSPSVSPENSYTGGDGEIHCCCENSAMDKQIARELFDDCKKAYNVLGTAADNVKIEGAEDIAALMDRIKYLNDRLEPVKLASDGRIMEWDREYKEPEPGHRHLSHLFALYPAGQITPYSTPELAAAAERTIDKRLSSGSGYTGWSRAWIINLYASLFNGGKAYKNLYEFMSSSVYPNLFDKHPPFQIDGNFGVCAAICRMIVQSTEQKVFLLPACPNEWSGGKITGVRLVGNAEINLKWSNLTPIYAEITAFSPYSADVYFNFKVKHINLSEGEKIKLYYKDFK